MATPRTTAVVVTYNSRPVVGPALDEAARARDAGLLECLVVDNASTDGTPDFIREAYPWVRLIETGRNLGFGRGCNAGLASVRTPYVLFLNPDAAIPPESLATLVEFLDAHPRAALAAPATETHDGSDLQAAGGLPTPWSILWNASGLAGSLGSGRLARAWSRLPRAGNNRQRVRSRRVIRPGEPAFQTNWLGGGILLGRLAVLQELGGFDPRFFLYFDETDLCRRAVKAGYELWAVGQAVARHIGGTAAKASGERLYRGSIAEHYFRSRLYYLVKHYGWPLAAATELLELGLLAARDAAKAVRKRERGELRERLQGPVLRLPPRVL